MSEKNKKLTIVSGDGKDLDISPVYEHLKNERPKSSSTYLFITPKSSG